MNKAYEDAGAQYLRAYDSGVWKRQHYRGVRILKAPTDLWNYEAIFAERRIDHADLQLKADAQIDLILEDSSQSDTAQREHVARELDALTPLLRPGDDLVVEDTCVNGHPESGVRTGSDGSTHSVN